MRKTKPKQDQIFLSIFEPKETTAAPGAEEKAPLEKREPYSSVAVPEIPTMVPEHRPLATVPIIVPEPSPAPQTTLSVDDKVIESPQAPPPGSPLVLTAEEASPPHAALSEPSSPAAALPCPEEIHTHDRLDAPDSFPPVQIDPAHGTVTPDTPKPASPIFPTTTEQFRPVVPRLSFVHILPGSFVMGSPQHEPGRNSDEIPHQVTITKGFWLQTMPITQREWQLVMGANPSRFQDEHGDLPLENVSFFDCQRFIERLNILDKHTYRLPTEAEWEYSCRAGSTGSSPAGEVIEVYCGYDENLDSLAWYCGNSKRTTHPVGQKNPNPWGLYDMLGNVFEWCQDWYGDYSSAPQENSVGPITGSGRVIRGGSWFSNAKNCRCASRFYWAPQSKSDFVGLRLVRKPKPKEGK